MESPFVKMHARQLRTYIIVAIFTGAISCTKSPLDARKDLQALGIPYTVDAFIQKVYSGDKIASHLFIASGMDLNAKNSEAWTAVHNAAQEGHVEILKELLERHAEASPRWSDGTTPLMIAVDRHHHEVVRILLKYGANPNETLTAHFSPLLDAASTGDTEMFELLLGAGAEAKSGAVYQDGSDISVAEKLIAMGQRRRWEATTKQKRDILKSLSKIKPVGYGNPISDAVVINDRALLETLINDGLDLNSARGNNASPAFIAITQGLFDMLSTLLEKGADPNIADSDGKTLLMRASEFRRNGNDNYVDILIKYKAKIEASDENGMTALHYAAENGNLRAIKSLLSMDADHRKLNGKHETPTDVAKRRAIAAKTLEDKKNYEKAIELLASPSPAVAH